MQKSGTRYNEIRLRQNFLNFKPVMKLLWVLFFLFLASVGETAESPAAKNSDVDAYVLCRNEKTVRTIRVNQAKGDGCVTLYTKAGVDSQVGQARNFNSCRQVLDKIRQNLENHSWACKDVSNASISGDSEISK
ncbi:MAG: hypothetical protein AB7O96_20415 [Pseudobdellovibrionaceae bacterium]